MKTRKKICVPVKKVAGVLSELLDCEMMPDRDSRTFVGQERITVLFVEGTAYNVLYGVRKAVKKGEVVSGDNFLRILASGWQILGRSFRWNGVRTSGLFSERAGA